VEEDVVSDPLDVSLLGAVGVVLAVQGLPNAVQEFGWARSGRGLFGLW